MQVPKLKGLMGQVNGDRSMVEELARQTANEIRPDGGKWKSFISVADDPCVSESLEIDSLLGCLFSVKDNIDVAGAITTCGSNLFAHSPPAVKDAWIVEVLKAAGAICLGKNNMHELALGATGMNPRFGTTRNPWDFDRGVGGSSGGSALAVALRQVHIAFGTDSGGSVRIPAAWCGVTGFKPTPGSLSLQGVAGACLTLDCLGIFSTEVGDLITIWDSLDLPKDSGTDNHSIRLGYLQDESMGPVDPRVWERYRESVDSLKRANFNLTGVSIEGFETAPHVALSVAYPEIASTHMELMRSSAKLYDPAILALLYLGELWAGRNYLDAQRARSLLRHRFWKIISPFDVVLTPTVAAQPPLIGQPAKVEGDSKGTELSTLMRFTVPFNVTGYPAISVPAGLDSDGLPVGLQLIGKPNSDTSLLKIASQVEDVLGIMPSPYDESTT